MNLEKQINIDGEKWIVRLSEKNELTLSFLVPYKRSIYATDPLWHDWDWTNEPKLNYFENYYESTGVSNLNIFRLKGKILQEIVALINMSKVNFFYYQANTVKKAQIYLRIGHSIVKLLNQDLFVKQWSVQGDGLWCYFYKKTM